MTSFAIGSTDKDVNIQALADVLETKGNATQQENVFKNWSTRNNCKYTGSRLTS